MSNLSPLPAQFLVNLGNRFAVFGPEGAVPESHFVPDDHLEDWPRVADESEIAPERIPQTLVVPNFEVEQPPSPEVADIVLRHGDQTTLVEVKIRERDPKHRDFDEAVRLIDAAAKLGQNLQVWFFNLERLKAVIVSGGGANLKIHTFVPWDVWAKGENGPFTRAYVTSKVDEWQSRVNAFYETVQGWAADQPGLETEIARNMVMSEELMQTFAVTDRELPILDVLRGSTVIGSFVPRGLWNIGSRGRIDLITESATRMIVDLSTDGPGDWRLVATGSRRQTTPFDREAFLALVGAV